MRSSSHTHATTAAMPTYPTIRLGSRLYGAELPCPWTEQAATSVSSAISATPSTRSPRLICDPIRNNMPAIRRPINSAA